MRFPLPFRRPRPLPTARDLAALALDVSNKHAASMGRPVVTWGELHPSNQQTYLDVVRVVTAAVGRPVS